MSKLRIGILFGGKSAEHEVSLQSAKNVIDALDKERYEPVLIGIDKQGRWQLNDASTFLLNTENPKLIALNSSNQEVALLPGNTDRQLISPNSPQSLGNLDAVFPVLHGPMGEDGTIQGLLTLADIPFVGAGVLGSAIGMDKDVMKRLLREAGLPIAQFLTATPTKPVSFDTTAKTVGMPCFIKPANMGSSVGVSKATDQESFETALAEAFKYDKKVIIEKYIPGDEIECAVLGNDNPEASLPGRIIPQADFYSYEAKYIDENGASMEIPATLAPETIKEVQRLAIATFQVLECSGMARVDMFLSKDGDITINEINTIPGFTKISMYPKLWEASGLSYTGLISKLIELAIERHQSQSLRVTTK